MEVTRENFLEAFPKIQTAVNECDFIAIDGEFTGLGGNLPSKVLFDTPAERYKRLKRGLSSHIIIQYGICTFKWNAESKQYEATPFNIYVFPRSAKGNEVFFQCQSSSIEFLASQGFDFNKLFYKGLSYMAPAQETRQRKRMETSYGKNDIEKTPKSKQLGEDGFKMKSPLFIPPSMKDFVDDICSQVETFSISEDEKVLDLPKATRFKRKLIIDVMQERYLSKFYVETVEDKKGDKHIRISKVDDEERKRRKDAKDEEKMAEFETAVGFLKVAKLLSESRKLIIGHNMLLDLLLTVGQFFAPLPDTLDEFKEMLMVMLPRLVDTKLMATSAPLNGKVSNSSLGGLYQFLEANFEGPDIVFCDGFDDYEDGADKFHEAGYDAYCTGVCFAKMALHLCNMQHPTEEKVAIDLNAELINVFINRVYVMRISGLSYLTINGPDAIPERKNVFHLQFPSDWSYAEINSLFGEFGGTFIAFMSSTTAFVSLDVEKNSGLVIKKLIVEKECKDCKVTTYWQHAGIDPLNKYDDVEIEEGEIRDEDDEDDENGNQAEDSEERDFEKNGRQGRKRTADESFEEAKDDRTVETESNEKTKAAAKRPKSGTKTAKGISNGKDFDEPEDW